MKTLFALALFSLTLQQSPTKLPTPSGLEVLSLKVKEKTLKADWGVPSMVSQKPPVLNPSLNRGIDRDEPPILAINRDTSQRIRDLQSLGDQKHGLPARGGTSPVYESLAQIQNANSKAIVRFVWGFQASAHLLYTEDQEFLCSVKINPAEAKNVKVISRIPHQRVVDVAASGANPSPEKPSLNDVIVNQVEFADGTIWQRPGWNAAVLARQGARKLERGKCLVL